MSESRHKHSRGLFERPVGSGIWWVLYYDADRKRHREKVGRKSDAIKLYQLRKADAAAGKKMPQNVREKNISFKTIAESGLEWSKLHKRDWKNDNLRIPVLINAFGEREADSIKPAELDAYISANAKAPATQNRLRALFSMIYREAHRNYHVTGNPARLVRMRPVNNARIRFLTDKEEEKLTAIIRKLFPHHADAFRIALHTGMRLSEQFTLEWNQVKFDLKIIHLDKTKNGSDRHIPLNSIALQAFRQIKKAAPQGNVSVFLTSRKKRIKTPRTWFEDVITESKLTDVTWHTCRHTFISRLVMAGVDLRAVMELAGHKSMAMTIRYAHLAPEHNASAIERLVNQQPPVQPLSKKVTR